MHIDPLEKKWMYVVVFMTVAERWRRRTTPTTVPIP